MKNKLYRRVITIALATAMIVSMSACGGNKSSVELNTGELQEVDPETLRFPLAEKATLTGMTSYPVNTESNPNNRTIFKRLQEKTNVEIAWTAIQGDQWGDKITLSMANLDTLTDFIFSAGFGDNDLLRYAEQGVIIPLEEYIEAYMPNLNAVFEKYPEYKKMCTDTDGHIWALPWIEQLGAEKTAIQTVGDMSFINKNGWIFLDWKFRQQLTSLSRC